ncbi:hypothetical protein NITLEN_11092 [Nitrospira lenta]|uniref:Uncharacterized protein n=1 Tax=Nitrospira lenta TaxID=1436998 RepID=A0A330LAM3_9BACT|nr:hypothetical protein NITLEN_11092 [Nitrospira lenta]
MTMVCSRNRERTPYGSRPSVEEKLGHLLKRRWVILLLDEENKITDVAIPPESWDDHSMLCETRLLAHKLDEH